MCIKCGCGKKAGQPGYGKGPKASTKKPVKSAPKSMKKNGK